MSQSRRIHVIDPVDVPNVRVCQFQESNTILLCIYTPYILTKILCHIVHQGLQDLIIMRIPNFIHVILVQDHTQPFLVHLAPQIGDAISAVLGVSHIMETPIEGSHPLLCQPHTIFPDIKHPIIVCPGGSIHYLNLIG